ncbi:MAG TPA: Stp1/IreP family PP2C-type Ser/Thr phosphatase, partial [Myxococcota bacterium]|nr:Stp1/IreP family PP2C-type Ser/Thr phosphatase [Myxococcota bacterium]
MDFSLASRTDVGRVRTNNEDNFLVAQELSLFVVCDGMGGHNAGEVASKLACDLVAQELAGATKLRERFEASGKPQDLKAVRKAMETALATACKEIYRQAQRNPEQQGMGTTCTAMMLMGHNKGILGHVGDSRLYVLRAGVLHQLTEDHTYVNELVKRGALSRDQAKNHPQGNVLSRAMGVQPSINVDTMIFDVDPGDTYLLCSDGVYNYYPDPQELAGSLQAANLEQGLHGLIDRALDRGGHDNCTGIVVRIGGAPPQPDAGVAAEQRIAILKRIPIFSHLTYHELVKVLGLTQLARIPAGTVIINEGEQGDEFYVVLAGEVEVLKGGAPITLLKAGVHL